MGLLTDPLDDILGTRAKVRLVRLFIGTKEWMSARDAARRIGMAKRSADLALLELVRTGVVRREEAGHQNIYRLNPHSVLVRYGGDRSEEDEPRRSDDARARGSALITLFRDEGAIGRELLDTLRDLVTVGVDAPPLWAGLFGSTARGEDTPDSDVDLAVVVASPDQVRRMQERLSDDGAGVEPGRQRGTAPIIRRRFGRNLSPVVVDLEQLHRLARLGDPLVAAWRQARRVAGRYDDVEDLLRGTH